MQNDCKNIVPMIIVEPEAVPDDSFDLMRHIRLHSTHHNPLGGLLEPVTEELEVSSVGSASVRTKISRKHSEETLCASVSRENSQDTIKAASELCSYVIASALSELQGEEADIECGNRGVVVDDSGAFLHLQESTEVADPLDFKIECVDISRDYNQNNLCPDQVAHDRMPEIIGPATEQILVSKSHLGILSTFVQDSFELEEIVTDEGESCRDEGSLTTELVESSRRKGLKRENSGDSSGFGEEPLSDKGPGSSPGMSGAGGSEALAAHESVSTCEVDETSQASKLGTKTPRSTFAQRRSRSLIKQRPVDGQDEIQVDRQRARSTSVDSMVVHADPFINDVETPVCGEICDVLAAKDIKADPLTSCASETPSSEYDRELELKPKVSKLCRTLSLKEALEGIKELCGRSNVPKNVNIRSSVKYKETLPPVNNYTSGTKASIFNGVNSDAVESPPKDTLRLPSNDRNQLGAKDEEQAIHSSEGGVWKDISEVRTPDDFLKNAEPAASGNTGESTLKNVRFEELEETLDGRGSVQQQVSSVMLWVLTNAARVQFPAGDLIPAP